MAVTRLLYQLQEGGNVIDVARDLSVALRTHKIHQKQIFTIVGGMVIDNPATSKSIEISTAPNTWYVRAAINRGFAHWKKQRHEVLKETGATPSEFADFRITLNGAGTGSFRTAITKDRNALGVEEWNLSQIEDDAGTAKSFHIIGDHTGSRYALLKGWIQTRGIPQASEPVMVDLDGNAILDYKEDFLMLADGTNDNIPDQLEDVVEENDERPFALLQAYGDDLDNSMNLQSQGFVYVSDNNPHQMIAGFKAICGQIHVECQAGVTGPLLYLDVVNTPEGF